MTQKFSEKEWLEDFKDFVSSEGVPVPEEISKSILRRILKSLNPSPWLVFAKLFGIHIVVGTLNLAICNQFGLNPFKTSFSLSDYFMKLGHSTCMVLCGVLFISLTVALCSAIFSYDEFRVFSKNAALQVFALSIFSLVSFIAFGAEITLGIALLWLVGAILGGLLTSSLVSLKMKNA